MSTEGTDEGPRARERGGIARAIGTVLANLILTVVLVLVLNALAALGLALWLGGDARPRGEDDPRIALPAYEDKDEARRIFRDFYRVPEAYFPYVGWRTTPFESETANVGADGDRLTPGAPADPRAVVRFFGGSTMWGTGVDDAHTIPALVQGRLPGVRAVNHGQSGWVSRQSLALLENLVADGAPTDLVVFYDGVNDTYVHCRGDVSLHGHGQEAFLRAAVAERKERERGALWRLARDATFGGLEELARVVTGRSQHRPPSLDDVPSRCATDPEYARRVADELWRRWRRARSVAAEAGADFLAVLQPVSSVGSPHVSYLPDPDWQRAEYEAVYGALRDRIAREDPDWVIDLTGVLDEGGPFYIDWSHLNAAGNARVAAALAPGIGQRAAPPPPAASPPRAGPS